MNLSKNKTPTRTYKSEIRLNKENSISILNHAIAHKRAFNWGLALKQREWKESKRNLSLFELQRVFNQIKATDPEIKSWNNNISSRVAKKAFEDLDKAYSNFFRRWSEGKRGKQAGFPKYKTSYQRDYFIWKGHLK